MDLRRATYFACCTYIAKLLLQLKATKIVLCVLPENVNNVMKSFYVDCCKSKHAICYTHIGHRLSSYNLTHQHNSYYPAFKSGPMKTAMKSCFEVDTIQLINAPHGGIHRQETFEEIVLSITDKASWQTLSRSNRRELRIKLQLHLQKC